MGERRMIKKEGKPPTKKRVAAVAPKPKSWHNQIPPLSCPDLSLDTTQQTIRQNLSGSGGTTKSWITSSPSSVCIKQACPQLVVSNICQEKIKIYGWCTDIPIGFSTSDIVMTGISSPAFAKRDPTNYYHWRTRDCRVTEPFSCDGRYMEFTNAIRFQKDKYYAISRQGCLALIEDEGNSGIFEITALARNRAVPCCEESRHFREYMLVWENEIYLVFLLSRASINVVDGVEVLRLDSTRLVWEKMDRLKGDAMFFVQDDRCMGISARVLGCSSRSKGSNCVYFTHDRADDGSWFVYDMETSCISPTSGPEIDHPIPEVRRKRR